MIQISKLVDTKADISLSDKYMLSQAPVTTKSPLIKQAFDFYINALQKNRIVITTHHKRLASLLAQNEEVELLAAIYDEKNRKPTYDFIQGTIGKSYAFETASRYKIPLDVVIEAKKVYGEDKNRLNELIERSSILEKQYQQKIKILDKKIDSKRSLARYSLSN